MLAEGERFVPVVRDAAKWAALGLPGTARIAELSDPAALRLALQGAETIISTAHARAMRAEFQPSSVGSPEKP